MEKKDAYRVVNLLAFVGTNNTGKSTRMRKYLRIRDRNLILPPSRADHNWANIPELVPEVRFKVDPRDPRRKREIPYYIIPGINTFTGNRVLHVEGSNEERKGIFNAVINRRHGFHNGALFLDDFKNLVESQSLITGELRTFLGNRRMHRVDIYLSAWSFSDINADFMGFGPRFLVGYVERPPDAVVRQKMPDFERLMDTWRRSRAANERYPEGQRHIFLPYPPADEPDPA